MPGFRSNLALLKHFNTVNISFNPFNANSSTARMFIAPLTSENAKKANEKMMVKCDIGTHVNEPAINIKYSDGKTASIKTASMKFEDIEKSLFKHASSLHSKEEGA